MIWILVLMQYSSSDGSITPQYAEMYQSRAECQAQIPQRFMFNRITKYCVPLIPKESK